jgi:hypothetical protein
MWFSEPIDGPSPGPMARSGVAREVELVTKWDSKLPIDFGPTVWGGGVFRLKLLIVFE